MLSAPPKIVKPYPIHTSNRRIAVDDLLDFMHERQRIYLKRNAGEPFPWTADPVLRRYRLENVYREQDRETVWLRENWREPYCDHPNLWFAVCLFRMINWSATMAEIGFPETWNPRHVLSVLENRRLRGEKTFTSAYRLQHHGEKGEGGTARYLVRVLDRLWRESANGQNPPPWESSDSASLQSAHRWLAQFYGFSGQPGFLAYEIVTDLRHTRYLRNPPDVNNWGNTGPGAAAGICRLLGLDPKTKMPEHDQLRYLRSIYRRIARERDRRILPTLELRDIEHSLCGYAKYEKAREAVRTGRPVTLEVYRPPRRTLV